MVASIGDSVSRFRIVSRLGAGGMGVVFRAHDDSLGRDLALKLLQPDAVADENARARMIRQVRTASSLSHPHIAHISEVGEHDGHLYIAMELVEGTSLRERIPSQGMPPDAILPLAMQMADALGYAHQHGVIHRDLKSENVMVTPEGWVKVLDFGLAKRMRDLPSAEPTVDLHLTATGMIMGTPMYLAPEVLQGGSSDARSDVWVLGVVLYHMTTGRLPFVAGSVRELANAISVMRLAEALQYRAYEARRFATA